MAYNPKDHYFKKAKKENFAARSIFKLEEIDQKLKIFRPGQMVLDLGAAPGSWSQYASARIGAGGRLLGVDITPIELSLPNATFISADLRDLNLEDVFREQGFAPVFDIVMSDMAPKTTGIKMTDQARSLELCELALETARKFLKPKGHFVCKLFQSEDFNAFRDQMKTMFDRVDVLKPKATRQISKEIFLTGLSRRGNVRPS
ncbi:MAG: RlmE family RNA methyltransferase [Bdellovibrionaceae bacterium]|nr:RlmE family RNA methyltransferase [Pseudobdellovibrionaceae bacterium]